MAIKRFFMGVLISVLPLSAAGVEGMWIPALIESNIQQMQQMGLKLSASDLYSESQTSLKDAVVRFGRGCTGAFVSPEGLLITNHHCGLSQIQRHSSIENDYITNGYYARHRDEELSNPGLSVSILVRMQDVTDQIVPFLRGNISEAERTKKIDSISRLIVNEATENRKYQAVVAPFYYGNEYYLFVTQVFSDVRLVVAPPAFIGKFGGDQDNWMWPRHSGDFAIFRVYADSLNQPNDYHPTNQPFKPKHFFPISTKLISEGDFTMVYGFPGRTNQYLISNEVDFITNHQNPTSIGLRSKTLEIFYKDMAQSDQVRIKYTSKAASVSNSWKRWQGENKGLQRLGAINAKRVWEKKFDEWAGSKDDGLPYRGLLNSIYETHSRVIPFRLATTLFNEAGRRIEVVRFAQNFFGLVEMSKINETTEAQIARQLLRVKSAAETFFKDFNPATDQKVMAKMLQAYTTMAQPPLVPPILLNLNKKHKGNFDDFANRAFSSSILTSEKKTMDFLEKYRKSHYRVLERDAIYQLSLSLDNFQSARVEPHQATIEKSLDSLYRVFLAGMKIMSPETNFFPDANGTLRITYGQVEGSNPRDAVRYNYFSTTEGILEKAQNAHIPEYEISDRFSKLLKGRNFEPYGVDGKLKVNFIGSNHTTGGNSGSPVIDANGNFIGINFDRNWESTMSDIMFDPEQCRNISVSSNYILWVVDQLAGISHLLEELTIIKD